MRACRLSKHAERDLADILRYTIETWGMKQGVDYLHILTAARTSIVDDPFLPGSRNRDDLADGCRAFRAGKHLLFYRVSEEFVDIARILHESMDFPRHIDGTSFD